MDLAGKRVLVTGAGGFIGSHLAERLVELGARVRAMVHYNALGGAGWLDASPARAELDVMAGDVTDRDSLRRAMDGANVVFHLAALIAIPYSYHAPASYLRTNAQGTLHVLQTAHELRVERVVHTSTSEVYGTARRVPIDEHHPLQAQSPYAASKIAADKLAEAFHCSFGLPVVTVRPFNTFGPRQSARAVLPTIIAQCLAAHEPRPPAPSSHALYSHAPSSHAPPPTSSPHAPPPPLWGRAGVGASPTPHAPRHTTPQRGQAPIVRLGSLHPTRDFNYVADTVEGFVLAATAPAAVGQTINLGSGREIAVGEAARLIARLIGAHVEIQCDDQRVRPQASEVERLVADNTRARALLGWQPRIGLEEGLQRTISWMREHIQRYPPAKYTL